MLNDCLLESENIQITKKDNKYLLQPTTVKAENTQKFVLKECGKFLKYEKKISFLSPFFIILPTKSHSSGFIIYLV